MGKRADAAKPVVSEKTLAVIEQARARQKKVSTASAKPVATPTRASTPPPSTGGVPSTPVPSIPSKPQASGQATPMSTQTALSTPVKSPDLKRHRSACSLGSSGSEVPSLPSFKSVEPIECPHHSDSATTLSLTEYYMNKMTTGQHRFCVHCGNHTYIAHDLIHAQERARKTSVVPGRTSCIRTQAYIS